jgi:hypothetical protein
LLVLVRLRVRDDAGTRTRRSITDDSTDQITATGY